MKSNSGFGYAQISGAQSPPPHMGEIRVVDVHIGHIRQKLGDEDLITTVLGVGYRFEEHGD